MEVGSPVRDSRAYQHLTRAGWERLRYDRGVLLPPPARSRLSDRLAQKPLHPPRPQPTGPPCSPRVPAACRKYQQPLLVTAEVLSGRHTFLVESVTVHTGPEGLEALGAKHGIRRNALTGNRRLRAACWSERVCMRVPECMCESVRTPVCVCLSVGAGFERTRRTRPPPS